MKPHRYTSRFPLRVKTPLSLACPSISISAACIGYLASPGRYFWFAILKAFLCYALSYVPIKMDSTLDAANSCLLNREIEKLKLSELTCRQGVIEVAKM